MRIFQGDVLKAIRNLDMLSLQSAQMSITLEMGGDFYILDPKIFHYNEITYALSLYATTG